MPANDYYDSTNVPATGAAITSATLRAEYNLIEAAFNKLPPLTGNGGKVVIVNAGGTALTADTFASLASAALALKANIADAIFTGLITIPQLKLDTTTLTVSGAELNFVDGVTSNIQTQLTANANNTATNTSNIATNTSNIATNTSDIALKANTGSPTFTGAATASGGVLVTGGTTAQKAIIYDATKGLQIRGGTGSANDFVLDNVAGDPLFANPTGTRHINAGGSFGRGIPVTKTASFTVGATENWITCVGTGTITVTLPTAAAYQGREIMIKNLAAFTVVSASSNVEPLSSGTPGTAILPATAGKWVTLVSNGTTWVTEQGNT